MVHIFKKMLQAYINIQWTYVQALSGNPCGKGIRFGCVLHLSLRRSFTQNAFLYSTVLLFHCFLCKHTLDGCFLMRHSSLKLLKNFAYILVLLYIGLIKCRICLNLVESSFPLSRPISQGLTGSSMSSVQLCVSLIKCIMQQHDSVQLNCCI